MAHSSHQIFNTLLTIGKPMVKTVPQAHPQLSQVTYIKRLAMKIMSFIFKTTRDANEQYFSDI